jgi:hypothetical protein
MLQVITENFMEMVQDMVNQNIQEALKKGGKAKKEAPNKPTQQKLNCKAGWLMGNRDDFQKLRDKPHLTEERAD